VNNPVMPCLPISSKEKHCSIRRLGLVRVRGEQGRVVAAIIQGIYFPIASAVAHRLQETQIGDPADA
jgi:hypothetical protein